MTSPRIILALLLLAAATAASGCGTTKMAEATQQLLTSDAVDRSVARIDFAPLEGQTVFLETKYIVDPKNATFVNANYVISSLRQQMFAAGCLMQDKAEDAEYIVEARVGTLGNDENSIIYGVPANNALSTATSVLPNGPPVPAIPEIALARKDDKMAAAKIAAFAYHRESHTVVWQSGLSVARSTAKDTWVLGIGPFERGTVHDGWEFAGSKLRLPFMQQRQPLTGPVAAYGQEMLFSRPAPKVEPKTEELQTPASGVQQASAEVQQPAAQPAAPPAAARNPSRQDPPPTPNRPNHGLATPDSTLVRSSRRLSQHFGPHRS
jgi:hypothetical protein